tara:strand:+ start:2051 stop:2623 length:573 start_codon:yes stop_codon:yes gene_type:complete
MENKTDYFSLIKTRLYLVLIIFSFLGPLLLATIMYKYSDVVPIAPPKSYGNLIDPVITINAENDFDNILERKKWTLMYVYENETCDLLCEATLYVMQQVRESLGRERSRVSNVIVINNDFENEQNEKIIKKYDKIRFIKVINKNFFKNLEKNHLYIIDPLGNIFIFYDKDFSAEGLKKDIKKILKVSRIG